MSGILNIKHFILENKRYYIDEDGKAKIRLDNIPIYIDEIREGGFSEKYRLLDESEYQITNNYITFVNTPEEYNISIKYYYYKELPLITGKSPYQMAKESGYDKTEEEFYTTLGNLDNYVTKDDTIISTENPTSATVGYAGQKCIVNKESLYICLGNNDGNYIWKLI